MQIDPNVPTHIPAGELGNVKGLLDRVLEGVIGNVTPEIMDMGLNLWFGLAVILVIWTALKVAFSGNFDMWTIVTLIMGLMIPYTMLKNYNTPIPGTSYTFPQIVVAQGAYVQGLFMSDASTVIPTALHGAAERIKANTDAAWQEANIWGFLAGRFHEVILGLVGTFVQILLFLLFLALWAILMAHVMWAQIAIAILIMMGPMLLVWLLFEPMAFLFWGWFKALITYSLYGAVAGAILRVFMGVGAGYITTLGNTTFTRDSIADLALWTISAAVLCISGIMASFKVGEFCTMIVSGGGAPGSGLMGLAMTAATGGKAALVRGAATAVKGK